MMTAVRRSGTRPAYGSGLQVSAIDVTANLFDSRRGGPCRRPGAQAELRERMQCFLPRRSATPSQPRPNDRRTVANRHPSGGGRESNPPGGGPSGSAPPRWPGSLLGLVLGALGQQPLQERGEISLHLDDLVRGVEAAAQPGVLALEPLDLAGQRIGRLAAPRTPQCLQCAGVAGTTPIHDVGGVQALPPQDRALGAGLGRLVELVKDRQLVAGSAAPPLGTLGHFRVGNLGHRASMHAGLGPLKGGGQRECLLTRPCWSVITTGQVPRRRLPQRVPAGLANIAGLLGQVVLGVRGRSHAAGRTWSAPPPPPRVSNPSRCWLIQRSICVTKSDANQEVCCWYLGRNPAAA